MNSKVKRIAIWICASLLALQFLGAGIGKLKVSSLERWHYWGYSDGFMHLIGVLEMLGAIGILIPKLRKWAAIGLIGIMLGAAYTHLAHDEISRLLHVAIVTLVACLVIWIDIKKIKLS
ncbi:MAG: DoxX family protein [Cyclobacteriaceae bacterium]|nr:DoxX family protein [Cyclobacteriaceae bacterium]